MIGCGVDLSTGTLKKKCGGFWGRKLLCDTCERKAEKQYPQGWRYYPGDVCKHGVYTGGSGIDWICGRCEGEGE